MAQELQYIGFSIMNITVPAAMASILGMEPKKAAKEAENGAYLSCAIPGARENALKVAELAKELYDWLGQVKHEVLP